MVVNKRKINNETVKPIQVPIVDPDKIKGYDLFPELYSNIFLLAKKKKKVTVKEVA